MRFLKSKKLNAAMNAIQRKANDAEGKLQHLQTQLCTGLKVDNLRDAIKMHIAGERFRPAFNAPVLAGNVHLDFDSKDEKETFCAPEASLKSSVFISTGPRRLTVARGAVRKKEKPRPVHGVSGMAGVGKTTALIGLGHEEDIKSHFVDGVLYMTIGKNATMGHIITELWKIMSVTGAEKSATAVRSSKSLADAIAVAGVWFHGRKILFLVDDVWPTQGRPEGYLPDLEGLLQGSPDSRMAISTRSLEIARKGGSHVDFGARDPCGPLSLAIFLAHALPDSPPLDHLLESSKSVLSLCAGLPISLSVAGAAVALRADSGDDFDDACQTYLETIRVQISKHPGTPFLDIAIRLSLAALAEDKGDNGYVGHEATKYSISELYVSLCVLGNQQFAPVAVLARMWGVSDAHADDICVSFKSMSLAKISTQVLDGRKQRGLNIHDLHLDFCRRSAARHGGEERVWHQRLLNSHMTLDASLNEVVDDSDDRIGVSMLEYKPRPWWEDDMANKDYIRKHVSRHLQGAGLDLELGSTVLDIRWISAQGQTGGVQGLLNDLRILERAIQESASSTMSRDAAASVKLIAQTVPGIATLLPLGTRKIFQEFCSLLFSISQTKEWIRLFLERMKKEIPKPFLFPIIHFFRYPVDDRKFEIDLSLPGQKLIPIVSTAFSTCGEYCAAGSNQDVAVFSLETQDRVKWLKGHATRVNVVSFGSDAGSLISGSLDGEVIVWDWKEAESPLFVLRGHEGPVTCLSTREKDSAFCSGSEDGSVKIWDTTSGRLLCKFTNGSEVECVSLCPASEVVAIGSRDGRLVLRDWVSDKTVFQYRSPENSAILSVKFGIDGGMLVCGNTDGLATAWKHPEWKQTPSVKVPGSLTHIALHADGQNALLGSSTGDVQLWNVGDEDLSKYNVSLGYRVNGLSFRKNGLEISVGHVKGFALAWTGPMCNPNLDFTDVRNNVLYDFALSDDGCRAATSTYDSMIRVWNCRTGTLMESYDAPLGGSRCITLSKNGTRLASSSPNGTISVWSAGICPADGNVSFSADDEAARCLSFSPDESRLLVCVENEVQIWKWESSEKVGQVPNFGCLNTCFSSDGVFIIIGNTLRAIVWDANGMEMVFDTSIESLMNMSVAEAKHVIKACGSRAHRMCLPSFRDSGAPIRPLTVDSIFNFVPYEKWPGKMAFCQNIFVESFGGRLIMSTLREDHTS